MSAGALAPGACRQSFGEHYDLPVTGSLALGRWATLVAGVTATASAALGLRHGTEGLYQSDDLTLAQVYGQDVTVLFVVLPVLGFSAWRARRGSARGLMGWAGALIYLAYWYHFLLGGIDFGPAYLLHLVLVGSSVLSLTVLAARVDVERLAHRFGAAVPARKIAAFMLIMAAVFASAALLDIVEHLRHRALIDDAARGLYSVDLTIMLPATVVAGVLLWRRASWGYLLAGPLLVNATLSAATLLAASVILADRDLSLRFVTGVLVSAMIVLGASVIAYLRGVRA